MKKALALGVPMVVVVVLWAWYDLRTKPANDRIQAGVRQIIEKEPSLKPMFDEAMSDDLLTTLEAKQIIDKANELKEQRAGERNTVAKKSPPSKSEPKKGGPRPAPPAELKPDRSDSAEKKVEWEYSEAVGGSGGNPFRAVDRKGKPMVGIAAKVSARGQQPVLRSLRPLFTAEAPRDKSAEYEVAKDGYAVGGLHFRAGEFVHAVRPVFLRMNGDQLNPNDSYLGKWIGDPERGEPYELISDGRLVIGTHGHRAANVRSAGVVYKTANE